MFVAGFIASSLAANAFNYAMPRDTPGGRARNLALNAVMSAMPALVLYVPMYAYLFATSDRLFGYGADDNSTMFVSWLLPLLVALPAGIVITRKLYQVTNNPYLGGIVCGALLALTRYSATMTWA